ncbi:hypothetical protein GB931_16810 [Modestobacter sp. I12A-02628]|uniref:Uncharacterized protein n=1 Tax=Goekera deserti TaxID=2497753 RepID=A0A7K3WDR8_9ACTN|nr:hypothetical protein [Goekera deserti]MPQ99546.1 hypothetical protein [Goekera deserti]NDI46442.1 hypothetical protein [Goekera deserti]NEL54625.1 hypothetical protein [Goekera deserti]
MTDDIDARLRRARPDDLTGESMQALLTRVRARVDAERLPTPRLRNRRLRPGNRLLLVAAAAVLITAVPVVVSVVGQEEEGAPSGLPIAVAQTGELSCGGGYASVVDPAAAQVRLLPDELPVGWAYTEIFARHETSQSCDAQSLVALRLDPAGVVTGRVAVSGPVDAFVNGPVIDRDSVPDSVFGLPARRFDLTPDADRYVDAEIHRWVWTDSGGRQWSAEVIGFGLDEARRQLSGVSIVGAAVAWAPVDPGWTLVHLRAGAPYVVPIDRVIWTVSLSGGLEGRGFDVYSNAEPRLPVAASAFIGDRLTELDGRGAVISPARGGEADGGAPGSLPLVTIGVDIEPGVSAVTRVAATDLAGVEQILTSLRQVPADDPRIKRYGTS